MYLIMSFSSKEEHRTYNCKEIINLFSPTTRTSVSVCLAYQESGLFLLYNNSVIGYSRLQPQIKVGLKKLFTFTFNNSVERP